MTTRTPYHAARLSSIALLKQRVERAHPRRGRKRLLIVEDHPETAVLMQYALRNTYETEAVATMDEALARAAEARFDGFLIDISLRSKKNGLDVLEALREAPRYRRAPMVAVTAHAMPGDRQRFLAAGFDDYVSKPFTADELRTVVARQLGQSAPSVISTTASS